MVRVVLVVIFGGRPLHGFVYGIMGLRGFLGICSDFEKSMEKLKKVKTHHSAIVISRDLVFPSKNTLYNFFYNYNIYITTFKQTLLCFHALKSCSVFSPDHYKSCKSLNPDMFPCSVFLAKSLHHYKYTATCICLYENRAYFWQNVRGLQ